jgi:hypothetical protein
MPVAEGGIGLRCQPVTDTMRFEVGLFALCFAAIRWTALGYVENVGSQFLSLRHRA